MVFNELIRLAEDEHACLDDAKEHLDRAITKIKEALEELQICKERLNRY